MRPWLKVPFVCNSQVNTKCDSTNSSRTIRRHNSIVKTPNYSWRYRFVTRWFCRRWRECLRRHFRVSWLPDHQCWSTKFPRTFAPETPHTRFHGKWLNSQHMPQCLIYDLWWCLPSCTNRCVLNIRWSCFNVFARQNCISQCVSPIRLPRIRETAAQITFPLDAMTIPCITVIGTWPIFCFVSVTEALRVAVANGQYPEADNRGTVIKCVSS